MKVDAHLLFDKMFYVFPFLQFPFCLKVLFHACSCRCRMFEIDFPISVVRDNFLGVEETKHIFPN